MGDLSKHPHPIPHDINWLLSNDPLKSQPTKKIWLLVMYFNDTDAEVKKPLKAGLVCMFTMCSSTTHTRWGMCALLMKFTSIMKWNMSSWCAVFQQYKWCQIWVAFHALTAVAQPYTHSSSPMSLIIPSARLHFVSRLLLTFVIRYHTDLTSLMAY